MADQVGPLPNIILEGSMVLVFRAVDLTTGADVAGVPVSAVSVYGDTVDEEAPLQLSEGPPPYLPYGTNV